MALSKVDLPQPLGPSSETNSPRRTVRSRALTATTSPKRTWRFSIVNQNLGAGAALFPPTGSQTRSHSFEKFDREGFANIDRCLLEACVYQQFLRGAPVCGFHPANGLRVGLQQRQARFHHRQLVIVGQFGLQTTVICAASSGAAMALAQPFRVAVTNLRTISGFSLSIFSVVNKVSAYKSMP